MPCMSCASANQAEFGSEILIHFPGLRNLAKPPVWAFPKLLICLDCGFSPFHVEQGELAALAEGTATSEVSTARDPPHPNWNANS
jgi:hypothetical protein